MFFNVIIVYYNIFIKLIEINISLKAVILLYGLSPSVDLYVVVYVAVNLLLGTVK